MDKINKFELEKPTLAVDVVIFGIKKGKVVTLLHERNKEPFVKAFALPGVAVRLDESLENAARRALMEKTGLLSDDFGCIFLEQLAAFDALYRDPRGRTVSVAYMGITVPEKIRINPDSDKIIWKPVSLISKGTLPFDHNQILDTAIQRLSGKLKYTNIAKGFLPQDFRIEALQEVYESILKTKLNRSNFRNKLLKIGVIEQINVLNNAVGEKGGRPPHLYRFTHDLVTALNRDFL